MQAIKLRPFVPSGADYALSQRFFEDLGFQKIYSDDGISIFRIGELEFYLQNFHNQDFQDQYMLELAVEDLDQWWEHIQTAGLADKYPIKVKEPKHYPWGKREVHLIDLAGVCWHISEAKKQ